MQPDGQQGLHKGGYADVDSMHVVRDGMATPPARRRTLHALPPPPGAMGSAGRPPRCRWPPAPGTASSSTGTDLPAPTAPVQRHHSPTACIAAAPARRPADATEAAAIAPSRAFVDSAQPRCLVSMVACSVPRYSTYSVHPMLSRMRLAVHEPTRPDRTCSWFTRALVQHSKVGPELQEGCKRVTEACWNLRAHLHLC